MKRTTYHIDKPALLRRLTGLSGWRKQKALPGYVAQEAFVPEGEDYAAHDREAFLRRDTMAGTAFVPVTAQLSIVLFSLDGTPRRRETIDLEDPRNRPFVTIERDEV
jgi:hypothetical protein